MEEAGSEKTHSECQPLWSHFGDDGRRLVFSHFPHAVPPASVVSTVTAGKKRPRRSHACSRLKLPAFKLKNKLSVSELRLKPAAADGITPDLGLPLGIVALAVVEVPVLMTLGAFGTMKLKNDRRNSAVRARRSETGSKLESAVSRQNDWSWRLLRRRHVHPRSYLKNR